MEPAEKTFRRTVGKDVVVEASTLVAGFQFRITDIAGRKEALYFTTSTDAESISQELQLRAGVAGINLTDEEGRLVRTTVAEALRAVKKRETGFVYDF